MMQGRRKAFKEKCICKEGKKNEPFPIKGQGTSYEREVVDLRDSDTGENSLKAIA